MGRVVFWALAVLVLLLTGCGGGGSAALNPDAPTGTITGMVDDLRGRAGDERATISIDGADLTVQTDAQGRFTLTEVPAGLHTLVAQRAQRAMALPVEVAAGKITQVGQLILEEAGGLAGVVTALDPGRPDQRLADAIVLITSLADDMADDAVPAPVRVLYTDAQGAFSLPVMPTGPYRVIIMQAGYLPVIEACTIVAGQTAQITAALQGIAVANGGMVTGVVRQRVADEGLVPLAKALVFLVPKGETQGVGIEMLRTPFLALTDAAGTYTIPNVAPDDYYAYAWRPGLARAQQALTMVGAGTSVVDFTLAPKPSASGVVQGTVTDATTHLPVVGARVYAIVPRPNAPLAGGGFLGSWAYTLIAMTDTQGQYRLQLPPAITALGVSATNYPTQTVPIVVEPGSGVTVDIALDAGALTLSGNVFTEGENATLVPVQGATVTAVRLPQRMVEIYHAPTDATGAYTLKLPAGHYAVTAQKGDWQADDIVMVITESTTQNFLLLPPPPAP